MGRAGVWGVCAGFGRKSISTCTIFSAFRLHISHETLVEHRRPAPSGIRNDLPDLLSRCMAAPEEAWKLMDTIDHKDFDYVPLLAMEPSYLFTLAQLKEKTSLDLARICMKY